MSLDLFHLDGRSALVTGAGRGIGRECALVLAQAGADVTICSRTESDLDEVGEQVSRLGRRCTTVVTDVSDTDRLPALVDSAVSAFGSLDIVVNNAGGSPPRPFADTSVRMLERAFHFNVTTAFELSRLALPHLLESEGSIVNISSAIGRLTDRGMTAYGTAKAALTHLTRLMAAELAPRVRVNAIAVGSTETDALAGVLTDELRSEMIAGTPMRRLGRPLDIAMGALYLASPAASWVTGKVLEIDGGMEAPNLKLGLPDL